MAPTRVCPQNPGAATGAVAEDILRSLLNPVGALRLLALFAVRIVTVLISLVATDLPMSDRWFIGWFGPRGIGTVVLGLLVIDRGEIQNTELIGTVVVVTVTLSLLLHSMTVAPGIRRLASPRAAVPTP